MTELTPREIVRELDRYIIGQADAKRAVAVALRNRYRRAQLPEEIREEVTPQNILMIGERGEENKNIYISQAVYKEIHNFTKNKTTNTGSTIGSRNDITENTRLIKQIMIRTTMIVQSHPGRVLTFNSLPCP